MVIGYDVINKYPTGYGMLNQQLSDSEKITKYGSIDNWYIANMVALDTILYKNMFSRNKDDQLKYSKMRKNLDAIERGLFNSGDYVKSSASLDGLIKDVDSFEHRVDIEHHDIITKNIKALEGEEIGRPFRWFAYDTSASGITSKQDEKLKLLVDLMGQQFEIKYAEILQQQGVETSIDPTKQQAEVQYRNEKLKSIQEIINFKNINNLGEYSANALLKYLIQYNQVDRKFIKGFVRYLALAQEIYRVEVNNNKPALRLINPLFIDYDLSPESDNIEDASYFREYEYDSVSNIISKYWNILTPEDVKYLEEHKGNWLGQLYPFNSEIQWGYTQGNITFVRIARFEWKGLRKIGIKTSYDEETGEEIKDIVDEIYKKKEGETIEWFWINWTQKGLRIADRIFADMGPLEWQVLDLENLDKCFSSYIGIRQWYSLGDRMLTYQYLYNLTWFNLKLSIARSAGKALLMDIAQMPKEDGWTPAKWLHFLKSFGIAVVNSLEKNEEGDTSHFNQFQSVDLTASAEIAAFISQLQFIKQELEDCTGITRQRLGQSQASETLGGIERSVSQSSAITESYFYIHNDVKKRVLELMLDVAKHCIKKGEKFAYILDDESRTFFEVSDELRFGSYGIFLSNSSKDKETLSAVKQFSQQYLQTKEIGFDDWIKINSTDSLAEAQKLATEAQAKTREIQQQQMDQQNQLVAQQNELKAKELEQDKYDTDTKAATAITVAKIQAGSRENNEVDNNMNETNDYIDAHKIEQQRIEHGDQMKIENKKLQQGDRKLDIEEKKANNPPQSNKK